MKALVLGIAHRKGIAKGSKNPYDFATLFMLRPVRAVASQNFTQTGHGFEVVEAKAAITAVDSFAGVKFPSELELATDTQVSSFGELEIIVTGVKRN